MMLLFFISCISFHSIGKLKDFSSQNERIHNAEQASLWASQSFAIRKAEKQAFSAQVVGQLRVANSEIISQMISVAKYSPHSSVRKQAFWTLGELGRELDQGKDSQAIHSFLLWALSNNPYGIESQLIIEAMIKNYVDHPHSTEEDVETLKSLHSFLAQTANPPSTLFVFQQNLQTLPVLTAVLKEQIREQDQVQIYTSTLELMRFLHQNQTQFYNAHNQYKEQLSEAFSLSTDLLKQASSSQSMILWFLGNVADRPPLSSYVVSEIVLLERELSPSNRFLLEEALFQMLEEESARQYFRERFLHSTAPFSWWHQTQLSDLDLVQELYNISVESE